MRLHYPDWRNPDDPVIGVQQLTTHVLRTEGAGMSQAS